MDGRLDGWMVWEARREDGGVYDTGKMCRRELIAGCTWNVNFVVSETSRKLSRIGGGVGWCRKWGEDLCMLRLLRGGVSNI